MKIKALSLLAILLASGCAVNSPRFAGRTPHLSKGDADAIWAQQMSRKASGQWLQNRAVVRAVRGSAIIHSEGFHKRAKVGMHVVGGGYVRTPHDAQVDFFLGENGPVLRLLEDSSLKLVRLDLRNQGDKKIVDTMIELQEGRLRGAVKPLDPESSYLIRTRGGVISFQSAQYEARADGTCWVIHGMARIFTGGKTYVVQAGEQYSPERGVAKIDPPSDPQQFGDAGVRTVVFRK